MEEFTCPHCKNPIHDEEALLCHFCGESLGRASGGALGQFKGKGKWLLAVIAGIVLLSFLGLSLM